MLANIFSEVEFLVFYSNGAVVPAPHCKPLGCGFESGSWLCLRDSFPLANVPWPDVLAVTSAEAELILILVIPFASQVYNKTICSYLMQLNASFHPSLMFDWCHRRLLPIFVLFCLQSVIENNVKGNKILVMCNPDNPSKWSVWNLNINNYYCNI